MPAPSAVLAGLGGPGRRMRATGKAGYMKARCACKGRISVAGDAGGHTVRPDARGQPHGVRRGVPGIRSVAADTAARMGPRVDHLLADARTVDRLRDFSRRVLHDRSSTSLAGRVARSTSRYFQHRAAQARWAHRSPVGHLPGASSCRVRCRRSSIRLGQEVGACRAHHVGSRGRGGNDFRRRQPERRFRRRPWLLYLELLRRRFLRADRGRHDQHRYRGLHFERAAARAGPAIASRRGCGQGSDERNGDPGSGSDPRSGTADQGRRNRRCQREQELWRRRSFAEGRGEGLLVHDRAQQAHGHDRAVRLRQEHADPLAGGIREAGDCRHRSR